MTDHDLTRKPDDIVRINYIEPDAPRSPPREPTIELVVNTVAPMDGVTRVHRMTENGWVATTIFEGDEALMDFARAMYGATPAPAAEPTPRDELTLTDADIDSMCLTWRHDFGLERDPADPFKSGMTPNEREALRHDMRQLIAHHWPRLAPPASAEAAPEQPKCIDDMACMMPGDCVRHGFCLADANREVDAIANAPLKPAEPDDPNLARHAFHGLAGHDCELCGWPFTHWKHALAVADDGLGRKPAEPSALVVRLRSTAQWEHDNGAEGYRDLFTDAADALAAREREIAELVHDNAQYVERDTQRLVELERAEASAEAAQANDARYKWLRQCKAGQWEWLNNRVRIDKGTIALDAAIDAGIADDAAVPAELWMPSSSELERKP